MELKEVSMPTRETYYLKHIQRVRFDVPVFCEPLSVFLCPRSDAYGQVRTTRLDVSPAPASVRTTTDLAGNVGWHVTFRDLTLSLTVSATSVVERHSVEQSKWREDITSWGQLESHDRLARAYLDHRHVSEAARHEGSILHNQLTRGAEGTTPLRFLRSLTEELGQQYSWERQCVGTAVIRAPRSQAAVRGELPARIAARMKSLQMSPALSGIGKSVAVNQDVNGGGDSLHADEAVRRTIDRFTSAARLANVPTRVVAGYSLSDEVVESQLKTWAECYLGPAGWIGFDPCSGQVADSRYLAVTTSSNFDTLRTVAGEFRGTAETPVWSTQIIVRRQ